MASKEQETVGDGHSGSARLGQVYPTIARWASGYGWVEFGIDGLDRPFVRALDEGGVVWEGACEYRNLDEALGDMEGGLARFMEEQGFVKRTPSVGQKRRPRKAARKVRGGPERSRRRAADPATKKVERLEEIAAELRRGEDFSITRLTVLKGLCEDRRAAGEFALFLARKARERLREGEAPDRYRKLVDRAVKEMKPYLEDPADERKDRLYDLLREMQAEQDEYKNIAWGSVRLIKSMDLLVAEKCLRAALRPDEAPQWLYQAARDYCERYDPRHGTGLIPSSAPMVQEIADFWRSDFGLDR
ncbi:MAG TPA: hypothetical protein VG406_06730 [Isosphaeraceae bacterium]|jgi:hypothetical protein|nr:hypothetical protein [Isosphaeraceae bacterium]